MISLDTETTGLDLYHGAKPFFVTICDETGKQQFWEWDVDPLTREPVIPEEDKQEIVLEIIDASGIVFHNCKFDVTALYNTEIVKAWPWRKTQDTIVAGHLLASNMPHNLTDMAIQYLGADINQYEQDIKDACNEARRFVRSKLKDWAIANDGRSDMPSAGKEPWKYDMWLPRALCVHLNADADHPWWTLLQQYANADSAITLALWKAVEQELHRRELWEIYLERMRLLPIAHGMELRGITLSETRLEQQMDEFTAEADKAATLCVNIAKSFDYDLEMPKGASPNNSLRSFMFDVLKLPQRFKKSAKSDNATLDKSAIDFYERTLSPNSKGALFIKNYKARSKRRTAISYMDGYRRYWLPLDSSLPDGTGQWWILHPTLNQCGSDTLRWSCRNPNEQNISAQEGFNLRYAFGPAPGREWWSLDAKNIELRIPAYESGEAELIHLFEHPDDPPYYGSNHLLTFDTLWPDLFKKYGVEAKKEFKSTNYHWAKCGNFAIQYGAMESTADAAYHLPGAYRKIKARFSKMAALNQKWINFADKYGYVETIPDKSVSSRGYPLLCTRTEFGKILPTVPLNYHVQGTAMWWTARAMVRVQRQLDEWRKKDGFDGHIALQVHDELVLDFPKVGDPVKDYESSKRGPTIYKSNLKRIRILQSLMAQCGDDISVPTPVGCEYNPENWSEGITL